MFQNSENSFSYSITHWFQPIYNLKSNNILGYEALLRDATSSKISPIDIFKKADENGCLNSFDLMSIKTALEAFEDRSTYIFLNIFPSTLLKEYFLDWWDIYIPQQTPVVLELLENEPISNWEKLKKITKELQGRDIKIAIDDMGAGYSFFRQWIELNPDFIKLDRYYIKNLATSPLKQKVIKSLVNLLSDSTEIIIEGVEKEADLGTAELLGIHYAQGYLIGKPSPLKEVFLNSR